MCKSDVDVEFCHVVFQPRDGRSHSAGSVFHIIALTEETKGFPRKFEQTDDKTMHLGSRCFNHLRDL